MSDSRACFLTSTFVSQIASVRMGLTSGMSLVVWWGVLTMSWSRIVSDPILICHLRAVLILYSGAQRRSPVPHRLAFWMNMQTASTAATCTVGILLVDVSRSAAYRDPNRQRWAQGREVWTWQAMMVWAAPSPAASDFLLPCTLMVALVKPVVLMAESLSF